MGRVDQGEAAVWASGLGIVGTLVGALGGAVVQGLISKRQVRDQEAVDVRHRLRDERRAAFAAVLDHCDEVTVSLGPIIAARAHPDWRDDADHRELWAPTNIALRTLQRSVTTVRITGPRTMADLAQAIHDAALAKANAMRAPGLDCGQRTTHYGEAGADLEVARTRFVDMAHSLLGPPSQ